MRENIFDNNYVVFNNHFIVAEIADTPEKREQGLMFRNYLDKDNVLNRYKTQSSDTNRQER